MRTAWQVAVSALLLVGVKTPVSAQPGYQSIGCPDPAAYVLTAKNAGESGQLHSGFSLFGTIKNVGLRAYKSKYTSEAAPTPALRVRLKKGNSVLKEEVLYGLKAGEEFKIYISVNENMTPSKFASTWFALTVEEILSPGGGPQSSLNPAYKAECNPGNNEKKIQGSGLGLQLANPSALLPCPDPAAYVLTAKNVGDSGQLYSGFSLSGTIKNVGLGPYKSKYASEAAPTPALRVRLKKGDSVLKEEVLYGLKAGEEFKIYISTNDKMSPSTFESTWFALTVEEILSPGGGPQSSLNPAYKAECNPGNNEKEIQGSGPRAWSSAGAGREIPWRNPEVI
jgi:hypothetical protein